MCFIFAKKIKDMVNEINEWYFLDPDNRKDDPNNGLFCCRCKKLLRNKTAIRVELHPREYWVRKASLTGKHLIGEDCWRKITKDQPIPKDKVFKELVEHLKR